MKSCLSLLFILLIQKFTLAQSWPNWLGPNYSGSLDEWEFDFPSELDEYPCLWKLELGTGWSSPVVLENRVVIHDRLEELERVRSIDLATGGTLWEFPYISSFRDDFGMNSGPRSTPAITNEVVVCHSPDGVVIGIDSETGKSLWQRDLRKDYDSAKGFFGRCSSPLILGQKVIVEVGGPTTGLVALDLHEGRTIWKSKARNADYASCIPYQANNGTLVLGFLRDGFVVVDAVTGQEKFFSKLRSSLNASVNAASPLVVKNQVFLSSCYGVGASLWELTSPEKSQPFPEVVLKWKMKDAMDCHYSTPVEYQGYLYGFHGRQERGASLRCLNLSDGTVMWNATSIKVGNLIRAGNKIFCLSETGELTVLKAESSAFQPIYRQQIAGKCRSHFALADGKLLARDERRLYCYDLSSPSKNHR